MEIERKFLVKETPSDLECYTSFDICQGYLDSGDPHVEKRVRRKGNKYFLTKKSKGLFVRDEKETEIPEKEFLRLWELARGIIEKKRYKIPFNGFVIELDIYHANLEGLVTAEVEFLSEKSAMEFICPLWFGKEVTNDKRYKNANLASYGLPTN